MGQGESKKGMHHREADSVEIGTAMTYFPEGNGLGWTKTPDHLKAQEQQELDDTLKKVVCRGAEYWVESTG